MEQWEKVLVKSKIGPLVVSQILTPAYRCNNDGWVSTTNGLVMIRENLVIDPSVPSLTIDSRYAGLSMLAVKIHCWIFPRSGRGPVCGIWTASDVKFRNYEGEGATVLVDPSKGDSTRIKITAQAKSLATATGILWGILCGEYVCQMRFKM
ncbi:MAG: hypothetical protein ABH832_04050 [bacterium]